MSASLNEVMKDGGAQQHSDLVARRTSPQAFFDAWPTFNKLQFFHEFAGTTVTVDQAGMIRDDLAAVIYTLVTPIGTIQVPGEMVRQDDGLEAHGLHDL
jgi:hypothetical protein